MLLFVAVCWCGGGVVWVNTPAPEVAKSYWRLKDDATMRDVIANIRADESHHRDVNHQFASLKPDQPSTLRSALCRLCWV